MLVLPCTMHVDMLISAVIMFFYSVRVWDVIILCPNAIFLLYLAIKTRTAVMKLRRSSSPVLTTFFLLVRVFTCVYCVD